ncbi:MAG TPA: lytic transglycosylase domain-containing protein, partial [Phnomibacter sp.]|nr:lytic transglycosylase domain-containing protein [Phnomibacter sp.]
MPAVPFSYPRFAAVTRLRSRIIGLCLAITGLLSTSNASAQGGYQVTFCGEVIPVSQQFVADKLMNVIKRMVGTVNMPSVRSQALAYFPYIEQQLRSYGLPTDLKYIPIVESNFQLITSKAGAYGFWQLMPGTARDYGLRIDEIIDERSDVIKATAAACQLLRDYYKFIFSRHKIYSWVLTAAAYNFGNGNIDKAIRSQGANYFSMNLNPETAAYVYRIIAVKELFEHPELYMKNFGQNIFRIAPPAPASTSAASNKKNVPTQQPTQPTQVQDDADDLADFENLTITASQTELPTEQKEPPSRFIHGKIVGKYKNFDDGNIVSIVLNDDLNGEVSLRKKRTVIKCIGYLI